MNSECAALMPGCNRDSQLGLWWTKDGIVLQGNKRKSRTEEQEKKSGQLREFETKVSKCRAY